ncbi:MAG: ATP-binding protein [Lachnospiraceae bacterium]|nr:ATP-binding protein [Lachnospiraceae bacterium]
MNNPFSLTFGREPKNLINTYEQFDEITGSFLMENPVSNAYLITGVRGSGKTVLLTSLQKYFDNLKDWVVLDLNTETDMLEYLASNIYEKSSIKFQLMKKEFSFSFKGVSVSIAGEKPISNVVTLLEKLLDITKKHKKKVLICIDDIYSNPNVKAFVQQFQILLRKDYPIFLLMTGLYENVRNLQNEKSLTFLYRAPQVRMNTLSLISIAESFEKELGVTKEEAVKMSKLTKGYAYAYQVLGYILFDAKKKKLDEDAINKFDVYLREYVYEKIYFDMPTNEKTVIIAMVNSKEKKLSEIIKYTKINREKMSQYRDKLIKKGIIISVGWGKIDFALPRFREYVMIQKEFD